MQLCGVIEAIRTDLDAGYLQSIAEFIHGDVFSDFLDMARHLLDEKYKDAMDSRVDVSHRAQHDAR